MKKFAEFLKTISNSEHKHKIESVLVWINKNYPNLVTEVKWSQPMFTDHRTFIIGFGVSKEHFLLV